MDKTEALFFLTFLIFPIVAVFISVNINRSKVFKILKPLIVFYLIHNISFLFGFSLKGDYIDCSIFSLEYFLFCLVIFTSFQFKSIYIRIISVLGSIIIIIVFIAGGLFILMVSYSYQADKVFHFESNKDFYETRRYVFGHATLADTRYTFNTYKVYSYLPFEKKIDETILYDTEYLEIDEGNLKISIEVNEGQRKILFKDEQGNIFKKIID